MRKNNIHDILQLAVIAIFTIMMLGLTSCSDDDKGGGENVVRVEMKCASDKPVALHGIGEKDHDGIKATYKYDKTFKTDDAQIAVSAKCDDSHALISLRVWINDKLVQEISNYGFVYTTNISLEGANSSNRRGVVRVIVSGSTDGVIYVDGLPTTDGMPIGIVGTFETVYYSTNKKFAVGCSSIDNSNKINIKVQVDGVTEVEASGYEYVSADLDI